MKALLMTFLLLNVFTTIQAAEQRTYIKYNSSEARVIIKTDGQNAIEASTYVDAQENEKFIQDLLNDKNSKLNELKVAIENENCQQFSSHTKSQIIGCGEVTITKEVRTSYGKGGWDMAGSSYSFFVGFTNEGSGRYFDTSYMVTISEVVEAQTNKDGTYAGTVIKTLNLGPIKRIDIGQGDKR